MPLHPTFPDACACIPLQLPHACIPESLAHAHSISACLIARVCGIMPCRAATHLFPDLYHHTWHTITPCVGSKGRPSDRRQCQCPPADTWRGTRRPLHTVFMRTCMVDSIGRFPCASPQIHGGTCETDQPDQGARGCGTLRSEEREGRVGGTPLLLRLSKDLRI